MIYLDYSATTPVDKDVLKTFDDVCLNYPGNANSMHKLGQDSNKLMEEAVNQIADILKVRPSEVIFTSGATESNNLAIKGIALEKKKGHIITTKLEHSSVSETVKYLARNGFEVDYIECDEYGLINLEELKKLIKDETILVSVSMVNSEVGIRNDVEKIGEFLKEYKNIFFHVDGTQAIGKISVDLTNIDLFSFSAHKFFGLKGAGVLIKKDNITITNLFHGGKSQTDFRAGTPALPLLVSTAKALRLATENIDENYLYVEKLNDKIKSALMEYDGISLNSNKHCIPHILNISLLNIKPETFINAMSEEEVYLSTQSACSRKNDASKTLLAMGKSREVVLGAIRISISYKTTEEEINRFLKVFDKKYNELMNVLRG